MTDKERIVKNEVITLLKYKRDFLTWLDTEKIESYLVNNHEVFYNSVGNTLTLTNQHQILTYLEGIKDE